MHHRNLPQPTERIERRISAVTSISMCVLTVIAQIATTLLLTHFLREKASYFYAILEIAGAIVAIRVYQRPGSPSYKLVWMCLLLALPVSGMILFCLWGGTHQAKSLSLRKIPPIPELESQRMGSAANLSRLTQRSPAWGRVAAYLQKRGFSLYRDTQAHYFGDGATFLEDLIQRLAQAEVYIFLEYYILAEGRVWDRMFSVLRDRAAAGVEVRIIFDDFGNLTLLSDETLQAIQNAGIEVEVFNPVHRYVNRSIPSTGMSTASTSTTGTIGRSPSSTAGPPIPAASTSPTNTPTSSSASATGRTAACASRGRAPGALRLSSCRCGR